MTTVDLTFYERMTVWNLVGNFQAPRLKDVAVLLRVIEKVRPTDVEATDYQLMSEGGQIKWNLPDAKAGARSIDLESDEAAALVTVIESVENVRVADAAWMCRLLEQLRPEPAAGLIPVHRTAT